MKRLVLAAVVMAAAPAAQAQSMNVPLITERVVRDICGPFIETGEMWPAIARAESFGYAVDHILPATIRLHAANRQPEPTEVEMRRSHAGVIRIRDSYGLLVCSVGIHEGGAGQIAEAAEPHLRALRFEPLLDDREAALAVSVWRGGDRQVVISRSAEFHPGSELVMTAPAPDQDD